MHSTSSRKWCLVPSTTISSQLQYKLTQLFASKEQKEKEQRETKKKKKTLLWINLENTSLARWSRTSSVQLLSCVQHFATSWTTAHQASLSSSTYRACSNPCPSSWWCHLTTSASVVSFSSCLQYFPASGSFSNESVLHTMWPKYWIKDNITNDILLSWTPWLTDLCLFSMSDSLWHHGL